MKSNSDTRPAIIEPLGNGAYHYNFNIEAVTLTEQGVDGEEPRTTYNYDTVKFWDKPTYEKLVRAVLREEIDETKELSYLNDYNAAVFGIIEEEEARNRAIKVYKEYLQFVRDTKIMVKRDLAAAEF